MTWIQRYRFREYVRNSMWVTPFCFVIVFGIAGALVWRLDRRLGWSLLGFRPGGALAAMAAIVGAMLTFTGFVFSILLVAVQFASAQLTPRVLKASLRDRFTKFALGTFSGTSYYALTILSRITEDFVPQLGLAVGAVLAAGSLLLFVLLIGRMALNLRPPTIVAQVGAGGRHVIETLYGRKSVGTTDPDRPASGWLGGEPTRTVRHAGRSGVVLALDAEGLVAEAARRDATIVLEPAVGDFVSTDTPLFHVFETGAAVDDRRLRDSVAVGQERTMEQDPAFAFRILVDIAIKALSPAINDPTTAVTAIDQIHQLLHYLGRRPLDAGRYRDAAGQVRLEVRTPTWEDYLSLAVDEIRQYGSTSVQVARRLRAMLEDLLETLPEARHPALRQELDLIARTIERSFPEAEDRTRAQQADLQGIGASRDAAHRWHVPAAGRS